MNATVLLAIIGIVVIACVIMCFAILNLCCAIISCHNKEESNVDAMSKIRREISRTETSDLDLCSIAAREMSTTGPQDNKQIWIEA